MSKIYKTLDERIDNEFYVDTNGKIIKYKPYYEPVDVTLSDGCKFTEKDDREKPFVHTSLHTEILRQYIGNEEYYLGKREYNTDYLERELGWIAIGKVCYFNPFAYKKPTTEQINTLFDLGYPYMNETFFTNTGAPFWEFKRWK